MRLSPNIQSLDRAYTGVGMVDMLNVTYIIPDANVLIGEWRRFIEYLKQYKDRIIIGLPQILVEESLEKGRSLYAFVCNRSDDKDRFMQHLEKIESEFRNKGFNVELILIAGIFGVSRFGMCYYVGEESEKFLSQAIRKYLDRKHKATLRYVLQYCLRIEQRDDVKAFREALFECCNLLGSGDKNCEGQCKALYGMLGDVLVLSAAYYAYQKGARVVVVSEEKAMCDVVRGLSRDGYYDEKSVKCTSIEGLREVL